MKKRILSLFLSLVMLASLLTVAVVPASAVTFDGGDGSRDNPYLISTKAQLEGFRDLVNGGSRAICGALTGNIDLQNTQWEPIGLSSSGYAGTFDGNGYAIRNLQISEVVNSSGGLNGGGLFGNLGSSGVVKRVNVAGTISINGTYKVPDIGMVVGGNFGTIEECFATVNFQNSTITATGSGWTNIGGIAGVNSGTIRNCYTVGTISAAVNGSSMYSLDVGGIAGKVKSKYSVIENCYSAVTIRVSSNKTLYVGSLVGLMDTTGTVKNSYGNTDLCSALFGSGNSNTSRVTGCAAKSTANMKTTSFVNLLGNAYAMDKENVNQGYPVLSALAYDEESGWSDWFEDETMSDAQQQEIFNALIPAELKNKDLTKDITRAEFCAVAVQLYEQMGGPVLNAASLSSPFVDTSSDAVKKAYQLGITNGTSATTFDPYTLISREQLATMLTRVYKSLNLPGWTLATDGQFKLDSSGTKKFSDDQYISGYAKPSVYFMVKNGVIKGLTDTTFGPRNLTTYEEAIGYANASREQALIMAVRMFQKL